MTLPQRPSPFSDANETLALVFIFVSVIAYSALPVLAAYAIKTVDPTVYVAKSFVQYATLQIGVWIIARHVVGAKPSGSVAGVLQWTPRTIMILMAAGALFAISYGALVTSFLFVDKAGATVLYEAWPIVVAVGLPVVLGARFRPLTAGDAIYLGVAFLGVAMIVLGGDAADPSQQIPEKTANAQWLGYGLALVSGLSMGAGIIVKGALMDALSGARQAVPVIAIIESAHRALGASVLIIFAVMVTRPPLAQWFALDLSTPFAFLELVGATSFWLAILSSRRSVITVVWFLTPLMAVCWLYLLGLAHINAFVLGGAVIIIAANVAAHRSSKRRPSHTGRPSSSVD